MDPQPQDQAPTNLWFRRKTYGWGWTPCTWQGWMVIAGFVIGSGAYPLIEALSRQPISMPLFLYSEFIVCAALTCICYLKGEKPRWQWGEDKNNG